MSKKHFEALAKALKARINETRGTHVGNAYICAAEDVANVCASFNVNFDRARFLKACGVQESN